MNISSFSLRTGRTVRWSWFNSSSVFGNSQVSDVDDFVAWRFWSSVSEVLGVSTVLVERRGFTLGSLRVLGVQLEVHIGLVITSVHTQRHVVFAVRWVEGDVSVGGWSLESNIGGPDLVGRVGDSWSVLSVLDIVEGGDSVVISGDSLDYVSSDRSSSSEIDIDS